MKTIPTNIRLLLLIVFLSLVPSTCLLAQKNHQEIQTYLNQLFFNINVDTCQYEILKDIVSNPVYNLEFKDYVLKREDYPNTLKHRNDIVFKLVDNNQNLANSDATFLILKYYDGIVPALHEKKVNKAEISYAVSMNLFFSDSAVAANAYHNILDQLAKDLNGTFVPEERPKNRYLNSAYLMELSIKEGDFYEKRTLEVATQNAKQSHLITIEFRRPIKDCKEELIY